MVHAFFHPPYLFHLSQSWHSTLVHKRFRTREGGRVTRFSCPITELATKVVQRYPTTWKVVWIIDEKWHKKIERRNASLLLHCMQHIALCLVSIRLLTVAHFGVKVNFLANLTMLILHEYLLLVQLLPWKSNQFRCVQNPKEWNKVYCSVCVILASLRYHNYS
jgi:hypothetical protein